MSIESVYVNLCNYVDNINNINDFKSNNTFRSILEHVSHEQGVQYLNFIKSLTTMTENDITQYCTLNDMIGGGNKYDYGFITTSPSNFRYILHSHLILTHMRNIKLDNINLVEVGGGYGGLCLALNYMSNIYNIKITSYNIVDLPAMSKLQQQYLEKHSLNFPINIYSAFDYGKNIPINNMFLISNYCFSEISKENQNMYIKYLFPNVSHGFMVWNHIPLYNFGFEYNEEKEYPLTGSLNKYVYF